MSRIGPWINISSRDTYCMRTPIPIFVSEGSRGIVMSNKHPKNTPMQIFVREGGRVIVIVEEHP